MKTVTYVIISLISLSIFAASSSELKTQVLTDQFVIEQQFLINIEASSLECHSLRGSVLGQLGHCFVKGDLRAPNSSCDFMISVRDSSYSVIALECEE